MLKLLTPCKQWRERHDQKNKVVLLQHLHKNRYSVVPIQTLERLSKAEFPYSYSSFIEFQYVPVLNVVFNLLLLLPFLILHAPAPFIHASFPHIKFVEKSGCTLKENIKCRRGYFYLFFNQFY